VFPEVPAWKKKLNNHLRYINQLKRHLVVINNTIYNKILLQFSTYSSCYYIYIYIYQRTRTTYIYMSGCTIDCRVIPSYLKTNIIEKKIILLWKRWYNVFSIEVLVFHWLSLTLKEKFLQRQILQTSFQNKYQHIKLMINQELHFQIILSYQKLISYCSKGSETTFSEHIIMIN
jgi:hypothetical protein